MPLRMRRHHHSAAHPRGKTQVDTFTESWRVSNITPFGAPTNWLQGTFLAAGWQDYLVPMNDRHPGRKVPKGLIASRDLEYMWIAATQLWNLPSLRTPRAPLSRRLESAFTAL